MGMHTIKVFLKFYILIIHKINKDNENSIKSLKAAFGSKGASACAYRGISDTPYFLKSKYQPPICSQKNLGAIYRQNRTVCFQSQSSDLEKRYNTGLTYYQ
jgi:hypothetical protein